MRRFTPVRVDPTGHRETTAFVTRESGCGFEAVRVPEYPDSPRGEDLRRRRRELALTLRDAATALELKPSELSYLETGAMVFATDAEWDSAIAELMKAAG